MSTGTNAPRRSAWISRFDGPILNRPIAFGSPLIRHQYERSFEHVGRNVHMVSVFGRVLLGEEKINEAELAIYNRITEITTAIDRKLVTMEVTLKDRGVKVDDMASYNRPTALVVDIVVPAQTKYLKILEQADKYAQGFFTLWLEGEIDDKEKSKLELELKKLLRAIPSTTRKMRQYVHDKLEHSDHEDAKKEAAIMISDVKDDDVDPAIDGNETAEALLRKAKRQVKGKAPAPTADAAPAAPAAAEPVAAVA